MKQADHHKTTYETSRLP